MTTCSVPTCDRDVYAKGMCAPHYGRQLKGMPLDKPIRVRATKTATLEDKLLVGLPDRPADGCWEWKRAVTKLGYGKIGHSRTIIAAHRAAYETWIGTIPEGALIMHTCDNPPCCRPDHLRVGTHDENMADMVSKGRKEGRQGERNAQSDLTEADVLAIRADPRAPDVIAWDYGISLSQVRKILSGSRWKHLLTDDEKAKLADKSRGHKEGRQGERNSQATLTGADVLAIRADPRAPDVIAWDYGISVSNVRAILNRRRWKHI